MGREMDEVEVSIDEIRSMEDDEIELSSAEIAGNMGYAIMERLEEDDVGDKNRLLCLSMRDALNDRRYKAAYNKAMELMKGGYSKYRHEIEDCIMTCAENDLPEAMIYEAERYTKHGDGQAKPEAFPYLKKLSDMGYINSFRYLADCYYHGIGCERNMKAAEKSYFEAMLFDYSEHARDRYLSFHPDFEEYEGDDLIKRLIHSIAYEYRSRYRYAHSKLGELILDGKIKEYARETGFGLLCHWGYDDGISSYRLGECILYGIGTEPDAIVALMVLEAAYDDLDYIINDFDDELTQKMIAESFHEEKDFINAREETLRLIEYAKEEISKLDEYEIAKTHSGLTDPDQIYEQWMHEPLEYIKRGI